MSTPSGYATGLTDELLSTTAMALHKEIVSTIDIPLPFLDQIEKTREKEEGGIRMQVSWNFLRHSSTTQLSNGYEPVGMTIKPIGELGWEDWGDWIRPIVISGHEERINRGKAKIVSMLESRLKDTNLGMRAEFQQQLLEGNVSTMSDAVSLNGTDYANGLIESAAVTAQSNTIHNKARGGYTLTDGFTNQHYAGANSFGTNGLPGLYDICTRIQKISGKTGKHRGYISINGANHLKKVLQSNERYLSEKELDGGKRVMVYGGIPLDVVDLPTQTTAWTVLILDHSKIKWVEQTGYWFKLGQFASQPGYDVRAAYLQHMGQLKGEFFGSSGLLSNAEAY